MTRVGLVGAGFMGSTHAQAWAATDADLVAVIAGSDTPPATLAEQYGARTYDRYDAFLAEVDVVDICAPTHLHADLAIAAARAGRHVICEKPLARTPAQAQATIAACEAAGVQLLVAHVVRFFPEYAAVKAAVERGAVGTPAVLRLGRSTFQPRKAADNWFVDEEKSGGLVFDLMVHDIDAARWIAGDVVSVLARSVRSARPGAAGDHALAILRHDGGALTHLEASWAYPAPTFRTRGEVAGDAGFVAWDSDRTDPVRSLLRQGPESAGEIPAAMSSVQESPYTTQIRHFLEVLRGTQTPIVTAHDGLAAVQVAAAAAESIATRRAVAVGPARGFA